MSHNIKQIKNALHDAGYTTEESNGIVYVYDPVYVSAIGSKHLAISHWELRIIRDVPAAHNFIDTRS